MDFNNTLELCVSVCVFLINCLGGSTGSVVGIVCVI